MVWLQVLGPSLLMLLGGIVTWLIKSRIEELRTVEEGLREERRRIYSEMLDPMIRMFSDRSEKNMEKIIKKIQSYDYRKTAFNLNLIGSDDVVKAYNELMQYTYNLGESPKEKKAKEMIHLWGKVLLEIRKSLGNKKTKLNELDMFRAMITDIDRLSNE